MKCEVYLVASNDYPPSKIAMWVTRLFYLLFNIRLKPSHLLRFMFEDGKCYYHDYMMGSGVVHKSCFVCNVGTPGFPWFKKLSYETTKHRAEFHDHMLEQKAYFLYEADKKWFDKHYTPAGNYYDRE